MEQENPPCYASSQASCNQLPVTSAPNGEVGYLPQTLTLRQDTTIAELLGIQSILDAMKAIETGDVDQRHFDMIGDDWDIESRADEALDQIGFSAADLDRRVAEVSGGEGMLIAITGLRIRRTPITLLDEPTNNLDRMTRAKLADFVDQWPGTLIVVSHDLELLEHMDNTTELYGARLNTFGGPYSEWKEHQEQEQAAAVQAARSAQQALKVEKKQRIEAETKLARRERAGKKTQKDGGIPKILAGNRASKAQASAGSMRATLDDKVQAAQAAVDAADARVRDDERIRLVLPDPGVPRGRRLAELEYEGRTIVIQGPERVALIGANGAGKSTLIEQIVHRAEPIPGRPHGRLVTDLVGFLPQRLDGLDEDASAPIGWLRDFADTRQRLRDWVAASGTRLDRDRPTRQTTWPGEHDADPIEDTPITNRDEDFVAFVIADVERRRQIEHDYYASLNPETGEIA